MYIVCYACRRGYRVHPESIDFVAEKTCSNGHVHDVSCQCGRKLFAVRRLDATRWRSIDRKVPWRHPDKRTLGK